MKKIGILTFSNSYNYGAVLQSIALYKVINGKYDTYFINYCNRYENKDHKLLTYRKDQSLISNIKNNLSSIVFLQNYYLKKSFSNYINQYKYTKKYNDKTINNIDSDYDFDDIVLGSDQLWNPKIYGGQMDKTFLLDFKTKANKISYATSFGSYNLKDKEKNMFYDNLKDFKKIGVRESFAKNQLDNIGIKESTVVCDPTMLLSKDEWLEMLPKKNKYKDYVLVYLIGPYKNYINEIKYIKEKLNLKIVYVTFSNRKRMYVDEYARGYNPMEFLNLINDASYVITNSFHGTVFSILFNKKIIHVENQLNSIRAYELMKMFSLEKNIIKSNDKNIDKKVKNINNIDYNYKNKKLIEIREKNNEWLLDTIK